jgi:hypothetical protein
MRRALVPILTLGVLVGCGEGGDADTVLRDAHDTCLERGGIQQAVPDSKGSEDATVICKDGSAWVYDSGRLVKIAG